MCVQFYLEVLQILSVHEFWRKGLGDESIEFLASEDFYFVVEGHYVPEIIKICTLHLKKNIRNKLYSLRNQSKKFVSNALREPSKNESTFPHPHLNTFQ